jgi:chromosome partitioning protein
MAKTITVHINKGGQAKTTSAIFFATVLSKIGKTLLVDTDPQCTCTSLYSKHFKIDQEKTLTEVFASQLELKESIINIKNDFDLLPSNKGLVDVEKILEESPEFALLNILNPIQGDYDFIVIDTSPALSLQTKQALIAADIIAVPCSLDAVSFMELEYVSSFIQGDLLELKSKAGKPLQNTFILPTLYEANRTVQDLVLGDIKAKFNNVMQPIKRRTDVQQAAYIGLPIAPIEGTETYKRYQEIIESILKLEAV